MVPNVFVPFPSTVLFPRDRRLADPPALAATEKPMRLLVTVELETLAVTAPVLMPDTPIPSLLLLNATQFSILSSAVPELAAATKPFPLPEATLLRTTTVDLSKASTPFV